MLTIGHSTLAIEVFLRALKENGCEILHAEVSGVAAAPAVFAGGAV